MVDGRSNSVEIECGKRKPVESDKTGLRLLNGTGLRRVGLGWAGFGWAKLG